MSGDEIEIVVECCGNQDAKQSVASPEGWQAAGRSNLGGFHVPLAGGQGLHGCPDHASNTQCDHTNVLDPAAPHQRCLVVRFRKIEGNATSAAAKPGDWHRLKLATRATGGASRSDALATSTPLRFFAELGNGAKARLLAGE